MTEHRSVYGLPVSNATLKSSAKVREDFCKGTYMEQYLTNAARPFTTKMDDYLRSYELSLRCLNHRCILECEGVEE